VTIHASDIGMMQVPLNVIKFGVLKDL